MTKKNVSGRTEQSKNLIVAAANSRAHTVYGNVNLWSEENESF